MLMIRPIIRANKWRKRKVQIIVFFIFLVSNIGGCLTPVGDPPLLMGFMNGVDFFWSLHLIPILLLNIVLLLALFFVVDTNAYKKDIADGLKPEVLENKTPIQNMVAFVPGRHYYRSSLRRSVYTKTSDVRSSKCFICTAA